MNYLKEHPIRPEWFNQGITEDAVAYTEKFAQYLVEEKKDQIVSVTTSQLRKFFGAVKSLQMNINVHGFTEGEFVLLKPKLAYAVGRVRQKNSRVRDLRIADFSDVISAAIDIVNGSSDKEKAFKNFISFFEAIVAYHKRFGKDN